MKCILRPLVPIAAILVLTVSTGMAQTTPAPPPGPPGALSPAELPAPRTPSPPLERVMDGPVKRVDPAAKTVQVGWLFGLLGTTLEVTEGTDIVAGGSKASLLDIREGDRVKASYELRDGRYVAKSIEVIQPAAQEGAETSRRAPASPSYPMESPRGSTAPTPGSTSSQ